jgi:hypothetical protein
VKSENVKEARVAELVQGVGGLGPPRGHRQVCGASSRRRPFGRRNVMVFTFKRMGATTKVSRGGRFGERGLSVTVAPALNPTLSSGTL